MGVSGLRYAAAVLPAGRQRETLISDIERMLRDAFGNRVPPFDSAAAREHADIAAARRFAARPIAPAEGQIATIVRSRDLIIATRNVRDFSDMETELVDPWAGA